MAEYSHDECDRVETELNMAAALIEKISTELDTIKQEKSDLGVTHKANPALTAACGAAGYPPNVQVSRSNGNLDAITEEDRDLDIAKQVTRDLAAAVFAAVGSTGA